MIPITGRWREFFREMEREFQMDRERMRGVSIEERDGERGDERHLCRRQIEKK